MCNRDCFNCIYDDCIVSEADIAREKNRIRYEKQKDYYKAKNKAYYEANKEKCKALVKKWKEEHKEEISRYRREYYLKRKAKKESEITEANTRIM